MRQWKDAIVAREQRHITKGKKCWVPWCTLIILATQEAEIRRITDGIQPGQSSQDTISKKPTKMVGQVTQGVGPEFKHQYLKKKRKKSELDKHKDSHSNNETQKTLG
jgi:hypothetical protein